MQNIVSPTIPTYAAAYAADLNPAVVWTWISRGLFRPDGDSGRVGMKERDHSPVDVLRLAIVAKIARYGFTIRESFEIVRDHVDRLYSGLVGVAAPGGPVQVDIPLAVLVAQLDGISLRVSRRKGRTMVETKPVHADCGDLDHFAFLDLGRIAEAAADRLRRVTSG